MPDSNILISRRSRGENIIKHPQESYVEVSTRSITKIRSYASASKKKVVPVLCTISLSLWTACLGAILGYLPTICTMIKDNSFEQFADIYFWVIAICLISFVGWRILYSKSNHSLFGLIEVIEDELSEDRVPIKQASIETNNIPPNLIDLKGSNSIVPNANISQGGNNNEK